MKFSIVLLICIVAGAPALAQAGRRTGNTRFKDSAYPVKVKQPAVKQPARASGAIIPDSLLWVKQPVNAAGSTQRTGNRKPHVNKTKLDDLKNPFDTSKVAQQQPSNFSWGASNPTTRRSKQPAGVKMDSGAVNAPQPVPTKAKGIRTKAGKNG